MPVLDALSHCVEVREVAIAMSERGRGGRRDGRRDGSWTWGLVSKTVTVTSGLGDFGDRAASVKLFEWVSLHLV